MKAFDGWTAKFIARVAQQGVKTSVQMQGPYADVGSPVIDGSGTQLLPAAAAAAGGGQRSSNEPAGAIIIAGGVSITPAMAVLQELAASSAPQKPVLLLWSFRQRHELELLCPPLLALAGALRLSLTTRLFYTGPALNSVPKAVAEPQQHVLLLRNKADTDEFAADTDIIQAKDQNDNSVIHVNADPSAYESFKTCISSCSSSSCSSSSCSSSSCSSSSLSSFRSSRASSECGSGRIEAAASQPCLQVCWLRCCEVSTRHHQQPDGAISPVTLGSETIS
ncbi:hypothetical protein OEZ86_004547 [Tetradesmus obliquus]|nr:hypothetical protein OEZ86_004547 [Tetradesmus obliquus]